MKYKMLATDLDGTLVDNRKKISDRNKEAIHRAADAGVKIVLASGRPSIGQKAVRERLELTRIGGFMLACNGSHIVEYRNGREISLRSTSLEPVLIPHICEFARDHEVDSLTYNAVGILTENPEGEYLQKEAFNCGLPLIGVDCLEETVLQAKISTHKLVLTAAHEKLAALADDLKEMLNGEANVFFSEPHFLEITPPGIDKGTSLEWLCGHLGIAAEEMIACGDSGNDIPMLRYAGLGIAVENALPETKAAADCIVPSNEEDGVAEAIEKFIFA